MQKIFYNGRIFTGSLPLREAFILRGDTFAAVGSTREMLALKTEGDECVDLQGRFVCPGFIDSHMHLLNLGSSLTQCALGEATGSLEEMLAALKAFLDKSSLPQGAWLMGRGWNQDYFRPATGIPTRWDLDRVTRLHPVCIVRCCGHCLTLNSAALSLLGIDENTPCPPGGTLDRDDRGRLTGVIRDTAMSLVYTRLPAPDREQMKTMLKAAAKAMNAVGVTSCHTDDLCAFENVPWQEVIAAYQELEAEGALTVRVCEQSQFTDPKGLQSFLDRGFKTGVGSPMFRIGPLKLLGDGSLGARTAFLSGVYADAPQEKGLAIFTQEQLNDLLVLAHRNGMQAAVHVIGDGILDRVLNAYELAFQSCPRDDHRSGLVHVQLTRPDQLERIRRLQLHAYIQSVFLDYDTQIVHQRAGDKLAATSYAARSLLQMGLHVSNGTDCPVEIPHPLRGIQCAVTRQPLDGSLPPYRPEEALSLEEALITYTQEGAHASFEESFKGQILPGMAADFVILSQDPFQTLPHSLHTLQVTETWLGGRQVYQA